MWISAYYIGWKREGGGEYIGILPSGVYEHDWSDVEVMMVSYSSRIEHEDKFYYLKGCSIIQKIVKNGSGLGACI